MGWAANLAFAAAVLLAGSAAAQTTVCGPERGKWVCRGEPSPPRPYVPNAMNAIDAFERGRAARAQREAQEAEARAIYFEQQAAVQAMRERDRQQKAEAQEAAFGQEVVTLVIAGKCDEARSVALSANRLEVADQVGRVCRPRAPEQ